MNPNEKISEQSVERLPLLRLHGTDGALPAPRKLHLLHHLRVVVQLRPQVRLRLRQAVFVAFAQAFVGGGNEGAGPRVELLLLVFLV